MDIARGAQTKRPGDVEPAGAGFARRTVPADALRPFQPTMRENRADPLRLRGNMLRISAFRVAVELAVEPDSGVGPVSLRGCVRDAEGRGGLGDGHAGKEAELDQFGLFRRDDRKSG